MVNPFMFRTEHTETITTSSDYGRFYDKMKTAHCSISKDVLPLIKYVDLHIDEFVDDLKEMVAVPSVSGEFKHRHDINDMLKLVEKWLVKLGVKYERFDVGWYELDGVVIKRPTVILGSLGNCSSKKNLCVYGHVDVTSPDDQEWKSDPWTLEEVGNKLYGKGVVYGKGPLLSWFHAIEIYQRHKIELPVNIKFVIEALHERHSEGLETLLKAKKAKFTSLIDHIVVCDTEWLGGKIPCLTYGCVGICRFEITVSKASEDCDADPKDEIIKIFDRISDKDGNILIPKFNDLVVEITPEEELLYDTIEFNFEEIRATLPPNRQNWDKNLMLMHFWRLPDILVGDIKECECDKGDKAVKRNFVLKIVPRHTPECVAEIVNCHVFEACKEICCRCKVDCEMISGTRPWLQDFRSPNYEAARRATVQIYHDEPNMIREDKDIEIILLLERVTGKEALLLPIGCCGSKGGRANENIRKKNFTESIKLMISYLKELSLV